MTARGGVLYFAPGSGLGHMNRALAVCLELRRRDIPVEIVTNSPFAEGLARLSACRITRILTSDWSTFAPEYARHRRPALAVTDTFPLPLEVPTLHLARRVGQAPGLRRPLRPPHSNLTAIIISEPLSPTHEASVSATPATITRLPGPIRLPPGSIPTPIPPELDRLLDTGNLTLIVHSGPQPELRRLIDLAHPPRAAITPWPSAVSDCPSFEYYPAANLLHRAAHVISGAGYNMVADMMYLRDRHTAIPFERRYDDQAARLASRSTYPHDGTATAAEAISVLVK